MCSNAEGSLHFTFTKEQLETLLQELIAWKNFLCVAKISVSLENGDLQIRNSLGSEIKYKRYKLTFLEPKFGTMP